MCNVSIYVLNNVLFPAERKPMMPNRVFQDFMTSKHSFFAPPEPLKYSCIYSLFPLPLNSLG